MEDIELESRSIRVAEKVTAFLADEDVASVVKELQDRYVTQWRAAEKPSERETLWAQSRALDDLLTDLQRVVDTGHRAAIERHRRDSKRSTRTGT